MSRAKEGEFTPVTRVELKRIEAAQLIMEDELLRTAGLPRAVGPGKLPQLLKLGVGRRYPDRSSVFKQGTAGDALYFVLRGEARLVGKSGRDDVELGVARRGEVFGEQEALDGTPTRATSAIAAGELDVLELPRKVLVDCAGQRPAVLDYLREVAKARRAALDELSSFLDRW